MFPQNKLSRFLTPPTFAPGLGDDSEADGFPKPPPYYAQGGSMNPTIAAAPPRDSAIGTPPKSAGALPPTPPVPAAGAPPAYPTPQQAPQLQAIPTPPKPSILQRIAAAGLGAAAGYVNAAGRVRNPIDARAAQEGILRPGYAQKVAQVQAANQQAIEQGKLNTEAAQANEALARGEYSRNRLEAEKQERADAVKQRADAAKLADEAKQQKRQLDAFNALTKDRTIIYRKVGVDPPAGWEQVQVANPEAPDDVVAYAPSAITTVPKELVEFLPGYKEGSEIDRRTLDEASKSYRTKVEKLAEIQGKPAPAPTAESEKIKFQGYLGKMSDAGELPSGAMMDSRIMAKTIDSAKSLTREEKNAAKAYLAANNTPGSTGAAATIRVEGLGSIREMPVIDTKNGNTLQYASATEINRANQAEPGRYVPAGEGRNALNKTALLEDIRGSIQQTRESLATIPEFSASDKAMIAVALRDRDPKSAVSQLIGGAAGGHMTPQQQEYLINLAQLHEQALAMRSVLGAGQGSEDLRAAILRTIPGPSTPNKAYASKQLDAFEKTLNRLSRGVPTVPLKGDSASKQQSDPLGVR